MVLASALTAVVTHDQIDYEDWPLTVTIATLGGLAIPFSILFFVRYEKYVQRGEQYKRELDKLLFQQRGYSTGLLASDTCAAKLHRYTHAVNRLFPVSHLFWILIPAPLAVAGVILTIRSFNA
jgi:hypothetical protein